MLPAFFSHLIDARLLSPDEVQQTDDSFFCTACSLSTLLARAGIHTFFDAHGQSQRCDRFYDDWHLYAVILEQEAIYSLFKLREQENDAHLPADGDTPGVTVCFIAFDVSLLQSCLQAPSMENLQALNQEIDRVVAQRRQKHHPRLKRYWARAQSQAPYLIARMYTQHVASFAQDGLLPVPLRYTETYRKSRRLRQFIERNNRAAGYTVCDHTVIRLKNPLQLTRYEALAILATHTANTSFHSFAAEVQFHARCLLPILRLPILRKSPYDSAIRADMTIDVSRWHTLFPFYHDHSKWLKAQQKHHPHA